MDDGTPTVRDLILVLETYFQPSLSIQHVLYLLTTISSFHTLLCRHRKQAQEPRQPRQTAWRKITLPLLTAALSRLEAKDLGSVGLEEPEISEQATTLYGDIEQLVDFLALNRLTEEDGRTSLPQAAKPILITAHMSCKFCHPTRSLRLDKRKVFDVHVLGEDLRFIRGSLLVAECTRCGAVYYPDKVTVKHEQHRTRQQLLEAEPVYLCMSKSGIWAHRRVAIMQEGAMHRFTAGWSNFAHFVSDLSGRRVTRHQAKKLFTEHFSRRLLIAHGKLEEFRCAANPSLQELVLKVVEAIGRNGGMLPNALTHGCKDCAHRKRFRQDLIHEGAILQEGPDAAVAVAGLPDGGAGLAHPPEYNENRQNLNHDGNEPAPYVPPVPAMDPAPGPLAAAPRDIHVERQANAGAAERELEVNRGYVQMAVMDGKTVGHRICAVSDCKEPLVNYKDGRFCQAHLPLKQKCGIIPCGRDARQGSRTCELAAHQAWEASWVARFKRLSFPGVRRVIRRQQGAAFGANRPQENAGNPDLPVLHADLPALEDIAGHDVVHTFRARSIYCLQTLQWACGMPISWGKCYKSESQPQVLAIMNKTWAYNSTRRPAFLVYDDACDLLRHIVTQDPESPWLTESRLVVDAWHYVGHRATDALCRQYCNPAPANGSQPDLVKVAKDRNGRPHLTRAFNTETAEQFNALLTGYEAQLRQMSDISYDFFVHVLMMLFAETMEEHIEAKERELVDGFVEEE